MESVVVFSKKNGFGQRCKLCYCDRCFDDLWMNQESKLKKSHSKQEKISVCRAAHDQIHAKCSCSIERATFATLFCSLKKGGKTKFACFFWFK